MRQNWCTGEENPMVTKSSTTTCPAKVAPFTNNVLSATWQSCPTCADDRNRFSLPTVVFPPPPEVPRLIVTYSRKVFPSPTHSSVFSPRYRKSCGSPPTEQNG